MNKRLQLSILLEIIWWILTALVTFGTLYPIIKTTPGYPFLLTNSIFIIIFITFTRFVFLLRYTFLAYLQVVKIIVAFLCIPIFFYLINQLNDFQVFLDQEGVQAILPQASAGNHEKMIEFIRNEMIFFGTASIIATIVLPIRLILSVWRLRNRGTV